jgi:transposase-like protein
MHGSWATNSLPRRMASAMSGAQKAESGEMSKQAMRDEAERLVREALERKNIVVKQGKTRIDAKCRKCGAPNRVSANQGEVRAAFTCKECGEKQVTL